MRKAIHLTGFKAHKSNELFHCFNYAYMYLTLTDAPRPQRHSVHGYSLLFCLRYFSNMFYNRWPFKKILLIWNRFLCRDRRKPKSRGKPTWPSTIRNGCNCFLTNATSWERSNVCESAVLFTRPRKPVSLVFEEHCEFLYQQLWVEILAMLWKYIFTVYFFKVITCSTVPSYSKHR